jgi:hypothetical protein
MRQPRSLSLALFVLVSCSYEFIEGDTSQEDDDSADESGDTMGTGETADVDTEGALASCGDGMRQSEEPCDGEDLNQQSCSGLGFGSGTLACTATCMLDVSGCKDPSGCGDGGAGGDEECDGEDFKGRSCEDLGFAMGTLACTDRCMIDTSGCS